MIIDGFVHQLPDTDPAETQEWLDSLDAVVGAHGKVRGPVPGVQAARAGPGAPGRHTRRRSARRTSTPSRPRRSRGSPATSTSSAASGPTSAGTPRSWWSRPTSTPTASAATCPPSRRPPPSTTSASTTSSAARTTASPATTSTSRATPRPASTPGPSSRAASTEAQLDSFRREIGGDGLSSYPHPRLMPDFWEYPTVSMGLGPISSIYQARFNRYLHHRRIDDTAESRVWCFIGDGETDEPETLGSISLAAREGLDNLIWVVNCNLQRLDGPVRGNGKIIQELEAVFRGAGLERHQGDLGPAVGRPARPRRRRRAARADEHHRRRRVPALRHRGRRLHPRALLRARPPPAQAGRAPHRRRAPRPAPRRPRLPEALRRLQGRHRAASARPP